MIVLLLMCIVGNMNAMRSNRSNRNRRGRTGQSSVRRKNGNSKAQREYALFKEQLKEAKRLSKLEQIKLERIRKDEEFARQFQYQYSDDENTESECSCDGCRCDEKEKPDSDQIAQDEAYARQLQGEELINEKEEVVEKPVPRVLKEEEASEEENECGICMEVDADMEEKVTMDGEKVTIEERCSNGNCSKKTCTTCWNECMARKNLCPFCLTAQ